MTETIRQSGRKPAAGDPAPAAVDAPRPDVAPIVRSKIQPPALRPTTLSRQRLLDQLQEAVTCRVTLLVAEAGYGKTTLLADFAEHSGLRTLWYRLDANDADKVTWINHLVASCREHVADFGAATLSLMPKTAPAAALGSTIAHSFVGELAQLGNTPTLLILDDFHLVDHSDEVAALLGELIRDAPPWLHVVIVSRRRPTIELGRLAGLGELSELTTQDLRFSSIETQSLFSEKYGQPLEADVLSELDQRTKGWAASLQLFYGSIRGRPSTAVRALVRSLSGSKGPVYDFLAEEVLANAPDALSEVLMRSSLLDRIDAEHLLPLFDEGSARPTLEGLTQLLDQADRLGFVNPLSEVSDALQLHPLFRGFLRGLLEVRVGKVEIRRMHLRLAQEVVNREPLTACGHFLDAGESADAMACLGMSITHTMGSGQWGLASELINRLDGVPADPAVGAIQARRLMDEGNVVEAERLLLGIDLSSSAADVKAVVRQTTLSLGWRVGDNDLLFRTLRDIDADPETPQSLRDIAQVFIDASELSAPPATLSDLGRRLVAMSGSQEALGHSFHAAISLHNAAVAYLNAADYRGCLSAGHDALAMFDSLNFIAPERFSTLSVLAICHFELGETRLAVESCDAALSSGSEFADVPAELSLVYLVTGNRERGIELIHLAERQQLEHRTDSLGGAITASAKAFLELASRPSAAADILSIAPFPGPLDLGHNLGRRALLAQSLLLAGDPDGALTMATDALAEALARGARRASARLEVIVALAASDRERAASAIAHAAGAGQTSLCEVADAICASLHLIPKLPEALKAAIVRYPGRWLPALRRQLERGDVPSGHAAARVLDEFGGIEDVARLRAYARTYRRKGSGSQLGIALAKRVSPRFVVHDLGRVGLTVGSREFPLTTVRRKPATLLMYLVTRPSFTANREQVLDALWPDADPASSSNSLNQSLYFLRREIDPWYEDGVSADYVALEGDVIWLDSTLAAADSVEFLAAAATARAATASASQVMGCIWRYKGHFAPEFEYEEWAIEWRTRLLSTLLSLATASVKRLARDGELEDARDVALAAWEREPAAADLERQLIWLHWRLGATSAARTQYEHFAQLELDDGMVPSLSEIVETNDLP